MNNKTNGLIKGMAFGAVIATAVTMVVTNKKTMVKKAKQVVSQLDIDAFQNIFI